MEARKGGEGQARWREVRDALAGVKAAAVSDALSSQPNPKIECVYFSARFEIFPRGGGAKSSRAGVVGKYTFLDGRVLVGPLSDIISLSCGKRPRHDCCARAQRELLATSNIV